MAQCAGRGNRFMVSWKLNLCPRLTVSTAAGAAREGLSHHVTRLRGQDPCFLAQGKGRGRFGEHRPCDLPDGSLAPVDIVLTSRGLHDIRLQTHP